MWYAHTRARIQAHTHTEWWGNDRDMKPTERTPPSIQSWNSLSKKINEVASDCKPKYKINIHKWLLSIYTEINKWLNNGKEKTSFLWRRIPNNLCGFSALKGEDHNSQPLRHRLHKVTSFRRGQYEKEIKAKLYLFFLKL